VIAVNTSEGSHLHFLDVDVEETNPWASLNSRSRAIGRSVFRGCDE